MHHCLRGMDAPALSFLPLLDLLHLSLNSALPPLLSLLSSSSLPPPSLSPCFPSSHHQLKPIHILHLPSIPDSFSRSLFALPLRVDETGRRIKYCILS